MIFNIELYLYHYSLKLDSILREFGGRTRDTAVATIPSD